MKNLKYYLMMLVQCTWGIVQTVIGGFLFLYGWKSRHFRHRGCIVTAWDRPINVSLGLFVFVQDERFLDHEYGHCLQSLILGPLYLPVIGLPSLIWCRLPALERYRHRHHRSYYSFFTERNANTMSHKVTGKQIRL